MNIQKIVTELLRSGYTQQSLADELTRLGEPTNQSTIHRIVANENYQPKANKTLLLFRLYQELIEVA